MPDARPAPYSDAQLHERACIVCGAEGGELLPDGHVQIDGSTLSWAVAACPEHQGARS